MPGLGPIKIIPLNHLKKNGNGLLFPIFCEKAELAPKVRESLKKKKKQNTPLEFELTLQLTSAECTSALDH